MSVFSAKSVLEVQWYKYSVSFSGVLRGAVEKCVPGLGVTLTNRNRKHIVMIKPALQAYVRL